MQRLKPLLHIIDAISEAVAKIASFIIILLIGVVLWNVVMRYVFSSAAPWEETSTCAKLLPVYITLGAACILRDQGHIRVDVFYTRLTLRTRATIDLATSILFFLFCIALLLMGLDKAGAELARLRPSLRVLAPPSWPVGLITSAAISLLLFQGLAKFIRDLVTAITGKEIT